MKTLLLILLAVSALIDVALALGGFFMPEQLLAQFRVAVSDDTLFLAHVLAWFLMIVGLLCVWGIRLVLQRQEAGRALSMALGIWWVGIGVALAAKFGRAEHLLMDSAKGALLFVAAWKWRRD